MSQPPLGKPSSPLWQASLVAALFCGLAIAAVMVHGAFTTNPNGVFKDYTTGQLNLAALFSVLIQWQVVGTLLFWPITAAALYLKRR